MSVHGSKIFLFFDASVPVLVVVRLLYFSKSSQNFNSFPPPNCRAYSPFLHNLLGTHFYGKLAENSKISKAFISLSKMMCQDLRKRESFFVWSRLAGNHTFPSIHITQGPFIYNVSIFKVFF